MAPKKGGCSWFLIDHCWCRDCRRPWPWVRSQDVSVLYPNWQRCRDDGRLTVSNYYLLRYYSLPYRSGCCILQGWAFNLEMQKFLLIFTCLGLGYVIILSSFFLSSCIYSSGNLAKARITKSGLFANISQHPTHVSWTDPCTSNNAVE